MANQKFHAGNIILIGFGVMLLFMTYLVYQCTQNPSDMVTDNYYEKEMQFQTMLDARENMKPYQDSVWMQKKQNEFVLNMSSSFASQIDSIELNAYCLADSKKDQALSFLSHQQTTHNISTQNWQPGNYTLKFKFKGAGKMYYKELSLSL